MTGENQVILRVLQGAFVVLLFSLARSEALAAENSFHTIKGVIIEKYTGHPPYASGLGHFIVGLRTRSGKGEHYDFVITYFGDGQFFPKIGAVCDIEYKYADIYDDMKHARYAVAFGEYIIDPKGRKALGARPPCGCTELPKVAGSPAEQSSSCIGEQLREVSDADWTHDAAGQFQMK